MKLFSYKTAKENKKAFKTLTGLTLREFDELCVVFGETWKEFTHQADKDPHLGGRPYTLTAMEDRLLFILFYLKTYPLQEVLAFSFEMSLGEANTLVHQLSAILKATLNKGGFVPPRLSEAMIQRLEQENAQDLGEDGTERRIIRPANPDVQEVFYSGKAHCHTVKNVLVAGLEDRQIKGLSDTYEGKKHDKKICDEEAMHLPEGCDLYRDIGFQGQDLPGVHIHQPQKKQRGVERTPEEKEGNRMISSVRVVVEHVIAGVKRCRIVKDVFRNTKANYENEVMELACGLHNLRSYNRRFAY